MRTYIQVLVDMENRNNEYIGDSFERFTKLINGHEIAIAVWPGGSMMIKGRDLLANVATVCGVEEEPAYTAIPCNDPEHAAALKYLVDVGAITGTQEQIDAALNAQGAADAIEDNMRFVVRMPTTLGQPHRGTLH
jgi:hypothetical protein